MQHKLLPLPSSIWSEICEMCRQIVNAGFAKDEELNAGLLVRLNDYINSLIAVFGPHPELVETKADFSESSAERHELYRFALEVAKAHALPLLSICLSYAALLADEQMFAEAFALLQECGKEVREANQYDRQRWNELISTCETGKGKDKSAM